MIFLFAKNDKYANWLKLKRGREIGANHSSYDMTSGYEVLSVCILECVHVFWMLRNGVQ